ncbi:TPA: hypothetical protein SMF41_000395 [Serratia marcescens]|nr:hypothetical protein [Serratia marcescens]
MANKPYIVVNQFHGNILVGDPARDFTPGHVNLSYYDKDGKYLGTYGANHDNSWSGILEETETNKARMSKGQAWYNQSYIYPEENSFLKSWDYVRQGSIKTKNKEKEYELWGGNCVDFATQALCLVNENLGNYLKDGSVLKAYSKLRDTACPIDNSHRQRRSLQSNIDDFERIYGVKILRVIPANIGSPLKLYRDSKFVNDSYSIPRRRVNGAPAAEPSNYAWDNVKEFLVTRGTNCPSSKNYLVAYLTLVSPIVINLDGLGIKTTSVVGAKAMFDIAGSGDRCYTGWITPGSGFLICDNEGTGQVDSINDMFGGMERGEGFFKLARLDSNNDGVIDQSDPAFSKLKVWIDKNGDGIVDDGEIFSLAELGIESLCVEFDNVDEEDDNGNMIGERAYAVINGKKHEMSDVYFKYF